jgi:hypothetical protein
MPPRPALTPEAAEDLAVRALLHLAAEPERMGRFAAVTGFDPSDARSAAAQAGFLAGVLAFLLQDERELLAFAEAAQIRPVEASYRAATRRLKSTLTLFAEAGT